MNSLPVRISSSLLYIRHTLPTYVLNNYGIQLLNSDFMTLQVQVDEGVPLKICLSQFCKWIQKIQQQKKITFATRVSDISTSEVKLCAFVTWSGKKKKVVSINHK